MLIILSYILTTCSCLGITYYVFKLCAMEGEGGKILLLIVLSFIPLMNLILLLMFILQLLSDFLIMLIEKQLNKRKSK